MLRNSRPTLALASYNDSIVQIVANTLAHTPTYKDVRVVSIPLLTNTIGYGDFESLIETNFHATQVLLQTHEEVDLAMSVTRESISEVLEGKRHRRGFSVGLITACYKDGPLALFSGEDWVPEDRKHLFSKQANDVLDRLQKDVHTPPEDHIQGMSQTIGLALLARLYCDCAIEFSTLN